MESFPVNPVDILIILILLVSGGLAFARGFVRESLGLGAWIGAWIGSWIGTWIGAWVGAPASSQIGFRRLWPAPRRGLHILG